MSFEIFITSLSLFVNLAVGIFVGDTRARIRNLEKLFENLRDELREGGYR